MTRINIYDTNVNIPAPTYLTIEAQSFNSIKLTWQDNCTGEQGFKIFRKVNNGAWEQKAVVGENVQEWADPDASSGAEYYYRVVCYADLNYSTSVEKNYLFLLSAPTNLTLVPQSATSIKLSWQDSNQFEQGFKISRKMGTGAWEEDIAIVNANELEWIDTNAPIGNHYYYQIKAYAGSNASSVAEQNHNFILSAPTNLTLTPQSVTSIKLTWEDSNQFEQGFKISRKIGNGLWQEDFAIVNANVFEWIDLNSPYGVSYSYRVKAYAGTVTSQSNEHTQNFLLSAPTNLSLVPQSATSIKLIWQYSNQFEQGFKISRKIGSGAWEEDIATVNANVMEWTDNTYNSIQNYEYKVRAYYQNYQSDYSNNSIYYSPLVFVQGGTFNLVSNYTVTLSSYYIGRYEVTKAEWASVMTGNSNGISDTYPIDKVSWYGIMVYCNRRSIQEGLSPCYGKGGDTNPDNWGSVPNSLDAEWNAITMNMNVDGYRLPTEAEWQFAARGGNQSQAYYYSGSNTVGNVAWYYQNSGNTTHPVHTKAPNELGIYDMSGNVSEWCWDWYDDYPQGSFTDPMGVGNGSYRVVRGGCWNDTESSCTVSDRGFNNPYEHNNYNGIRILRRIP